MMEKPQGKNPFYEKLKKYTGKDVVVVMKSGTKIKGKLTAVNFQTLNFVIEGDSEDYIIRDDYSHILIKR